MEEEIKKRFVGNVDKFAGNFIAKNIHIGIYTNLYFGRGNVKNFTIGGLND